MLDWNMDIENKEIKDTLKKLQGKLSDMKPVMQDISETMRKKVQENFATEGKRLPGEWADLSPATKKQRSRTKVRSRDKEGNFRRYKRGNKKTGVKKGDYITRGIAPSWAETLLPSGETKREGKILQDSGQLLDSINVDFDQNSAAVGTNDIRAGAHQFGNPERNIPERSFLELTDGDLDEIENDILKWLKK